MNLLLTRLPLPPSYSPPKLQYSSFKMYPPWNPRHVVDALVHAATSKYPREQYIGKF